MSITHDHFRHSFRDAMSQLASAVTIVTTNGEAGRCGMTASAVTSVTDSPPTILVCVNRSSRACAIFQKNSVVCINVLSAEQEEMAKHFAGMTDMEMCARFALDGWSDGNDGLPILEGALANLQGRITHTQEIGSHNVYMVSIDDISVNKDMNALVYFARLFHKIEQPK